MFIVCLRTLPDHPLDTSSLVGCRNYGLLVYLLLRSQWVSRQVSPHSLSPSMGTIMIGKNSERYVS